MSEPPEGTAERLELLCRFVNTLEYPNGSDELRNAESASQWNGANGLPPVGDDGAAARLRGFREALRSVMWGGNLGQDEPVDRQGLEALSPYLGQRYVMTAEPETLRLWPSAGSEGAIAQLLAIVYESTLTGSWSRVRACRRGDCRYAYYDSSKNGARAWCSMAVCGNREKASRRRNRARAQTSAP